MKKYHNSYQNNLNMNLKNIFVIILLSKNTESLAWQTLLIHMMSFMGRPAVARDLFLKLLPDSLCEQVDFDTLKLEKETFAEGAADIFYSIEMNQQPAYLYLLCEQRRIKS